MALLSHTNQLSLSPSGVWFSNCRCLGERPAVLNILLGYLCTSCRSSGWSGWLGIQRHTSAVPQKVRGVVANSNNVRLAGGSLGLMSSFGHANGKK